MKIEMKKILFLILFLAFNTYGQGLIFSSVDELSSYDEFSSKSYGFADEIASSYSLEKYVPPVLNQKGGTCVGFSTFYYGLSTMYNIKFNTTDNREKYAHAFDPYFIYSLYYSKVNNCDKGLPFGSAFRNLSKIGAKKTMFPPYTNCNSEWTDNKLNQVIDYTEPYSISSWWIIHTYKPRFIEYVKNRIYNNFPVIVGVKIDDSMQPFRSENPDGIKSDGLWNPSLSSKKDGGHALCVIGYDDYKYGGAFRIVNSWGRNFGDNGYMWVKYSDFKTYVKEAFFFKLNKNIKNRPPSVISTDDYRRYSYKTNTNKYSSYEGQYINNSITGFGIWSNKDTNTYYVGKFNQGKMNGFFLILDKNGMSSANAVNGKLQDRKFGFAGNQELLKTELQAKKFFSDFGSEFSIRKASSTKSTTSGPSRDE